MTYLLENELRIGNLINLEAYESHYVTKSTIAEIESGEIHGTGIPLTATWRIKLGIRIIGMNKYEHIDSGLDLSCSYELKYVHQIQNLYFALTYKEI